MADPGQDKARTEGGKDYWGQVRVDENSEWLAMVNNGWSWVMMSDGWWCFIAADDGLWCIVQKLSAKKIASFPTPTLHHLIAVVPFTICGWLSFRGWVQVTTYTWAAGSHKAGLPLGNSLLHSKMWSLNIEPIQRPIPWQLTRLLIGWVVQIFPHENLWKFDECHWIGWRSTPFLDLQGRKDREDGFREVRLQLERSSFIQWTRCPHVWAVAAGDYNSWVTPYGGYHYLVVGRFRI